MVSVTEEATQQGGTLSPLLSNVVLDDLDDGLERRGQKFVRLFCWACSCGFYPDTPLGWKGMWGAYCDRESALFRMGARYYSVGIVRFISRDPSGFAAGPTSTPYAGAIQNVRTPELDSALGYEARRRAFYD